MPGCRRQRLHRQTGQYRPVAVVDARMAVPMSGGVLNFPLKGAAGEPLKDGGDDPKQRSRSGGNQVNILIVDDEPKNLTVLETVLDAPDYRLVRANSAE